MDKNKGLLALKLESSRKKQKITMEDISKRTDINVRGVSRILKGDDSYSLKAYSRVAEYLGVPMKPEKSLVTNKEPELKSGIEQCEDFKKRREDKQKTITKDKITNWGNTFPPETKLTKYDIVEREKAERDKLQESAHKVLDENYHPQIQEIHLKAPTIQNEFTKWQAWVIMALQVVVILFLIFPR